jgi:hypothetical protein
MGDRRQYRKAAREVTDSDFCFRQPRIHEIVRIPEAQLVGLADDGRKLLLNLSATRLFKKLLPSFRDGRRPAPESSHIEFFVLLDSGSPLRGVRNDDAGLFQQPVRA